MEKFKHRLLKETRVDPDFNRNSGETASIWGKWLQSKLMGVNYYDKFKKTLTIAKSLDRYNQKGLMAEVLDSNKAEFIKKDLTLETWNKEFPNNEVDTPFGKAIFVPT